MIFNNQQSWFLNQLKHLMLLKFNVLHRLMSGSCQILRSKKVKANLSMQINLKKQDTAMITNLKLIRSPTSISWPSNTLKQKASNLKHSIGPDKLADICSIEPKIKEDSLSGTKISKLLSRTKVVFVNKVILEMII